MSKRNILVPVDFTSAAVTATNYALSLAKALKAEVNLLHITKSEQDNKKAKTNFEQFLLKFKDTDVTINTVVKSGDIFVDIASVAKTLHTSIIVMGTHGAKGMQKVFGSFAVKVITSTHIPFVIVQDGNKHFTTDKIVLPFDTSKESLQIEQVVSAIAKFTKSQVKLVAEKYVDSALKIKASVHYGVMSKQFKEGGIQYDMTYLPKLTAKEVVKFAKKEQADLIAISYYKDTLISFDRFFQDLITNDEKIPTIIINSKEAGNYFF
ncbi:MAG TPA: universal stress protein [Crocinitomix sp.]|nr:universal stress protein [Crocinitomix sp.]